jgi:hypothetical protein
VAQLTAEAGKSARKSGVSSLRTNAVVADEPAVDAPPPLNLNDPVVQFERTLLAVMIQIPEACTLEQFARIAKANFSSPIHLALARTVYSERSASGDDGLFERVLAKTEDAHQSTLRELAMLPIQAADAPARLRVGVGTINKALERTIEYEKNALRGQRRQAEAVGDEASIADVDRKLIALTTELHALRSKR